MERGEPSDEEPIRHRPVHGHIQNVGPSTLSTGQEGQFRFVVEDAVDAFRVPHVHIRWYLIHYRDGNSDNHARANIERVDSENTNYIELNEEGLLTDRTFNADFHNRSGTFEIRAFVNHNFFLPAHFTLPNVIVKPPLQVIDQLRAEEEARAAADENILSFGDSGTRPAGGENFEFDDLTTHDRGYRYFGELSEERFAAGTGDFSDSFRTLDQQIAEMEALISHYETAQREQQQDNADLIDWARQRLGRLRSTRSQLSGFGENGNNRAIAIQGFYVSRSAGVGHSALNLACWFSYDTENSQYQGHIFDHTNLFSLDNPHVTAEDSSFLEMVEELFVELSSAYPNGMMSLSFQRYDNPTTPSRQTVTFERVTDTLTGDIRGVVFSAPVSFAVNAVAAILTVFPPTTGLGIGLSLVYNGAATALEVSEAYRTDTLRASHAVDVGLVALDVIPAIGRLGRLARAGRTAESAVRAAQAMEEVGGIYRVLSVTSEVVQASGDFYMFTDEAIRTIDQRINDQIIELAGIESRISTLQRQGAPAAVLAVERERATRSSNQHPQYHRGNACRTGATQALTIASRYQRPAQHHLGHRGRAEGGDADGPLIPEPPTTRDRYGADTETATGTRDRSEAEALRKLMHRKGGVDAHRPEPDAELPDTGRWWAAARWKYAEVLKALPALCGVEVRHEPGPRNDWPHLYCSRSQRAQPASATAPDDNPWFCNAIRGLADLVRIGIRE
ncbi:MAG: hypothetical protein R3B47_15665 [Bacteroidia bacterium]